MTGGGDMTPVRLVALAAVYQAAADLGWGSPLSPDPVARAGQEDQIARLAGDAAVVEPWQGIRLIDMAAADAVIARIRAEVAAGQEMEARLAAEAAAGPPVAPAGPVRGTEMTDRPGQHRTPLAGLGIGQQI
jgi:hypothetical protein